MTIYSVSAREYSRDIKEFGFIFNPFLCTQMEEMEEEGSVAPGTYRNSMISKVQSYRRELDKLKRDLVSTCFKINVLIHANQLSRIF